MYRNKKFIVLVIVLILATGCGAAATEVEEAVETVRVVESAGEEVATRPVAEETVTRVAESSGEEEISMTNVLVDEPDVLKEETTEIDTSLWVFDDEKISIAVEAGLASPYDSVQEESYDPSQEAVIQYMPGLQSAELYASMTHKGFSGLSLTYDKITYKWDDIFGDLDYTTEDKTLLVKVRGNDLYEEDAIDEHQKYFRYYKEASGIFYEVSDFMVGNFLDPEAVLTNKKLGMSCLYKGIDGFVAPAYNPLVLDSGEVLIDCYLTTFQEEPAVYIETQNGNKLHRKWTSVEKGLLLQELIFTDVGLLEQSKLLLTSVEETLNDEVFEQPKDIDYKDITLFLYSASGGDLETLTEALIGTFSEEPFSMTLTDSSGTSFQIHCGGIGDISIDQPYYFYLRENIDGEPRMIIEYRLEDYYYTVSHEMEMAERYQTSSREKLFFNFDQVGFSGFTENGSIKTYTFYHNQKSVSGMLEFYAYNIDGTVGEILSVAVYNKETLGREETIGESNIYKITEFGEVDESLFEIPATYEMIDRGKNSHDDGEWMPFWYQ